MYNKILAAYRLEIKYTSIIFLIVPPDNHRRNLADKAIKTWKDHFIGVMSGTAAAFPAHIWCQEIPQAESQLLLLRHSNVKSMISAYAHVYGPHNCNGAPFLPIGMETIMQDNPKRRGTFAEHFGKGFILGTAF